MESSQISISAELIAALFGAISTVIGGIWILVTFAISRIDRRFDAQDAAHDKIHADLKQIAERQRDHDVTLENHGVRLRELEDSGPRAAAS